MCACTQLVSQLVAYLSSYHEKAIKALYELAQELPAICLPHQDGVIPLSAFPNGTTSKHAGLFSTLSLQCWTSSREAVNTNFKVIGLTRLGIKPESTAQEADALYHSAIWAVTRCPEPLLLPLTKIVSKFCPNRKIWVVITHEKIWSMQSIYFLTLRDTLCREFWRTLRSRRW